MSAVEQKNGYKIVNRRGEHHVQGYSTGLFATPRNSQQQDYYRPRPYGVIDQSAGIDEFDWSELLDFSRQLFAQRGNLGAAVVQKNLYAFGDAWKPTYLGANEAWGNEVEAWLREVWYPNCDVRGGVFDFNTSLMLSGIAWDVDGDDVMVLAEREDGFPQLKFYASHEIGSRGNKDEAKGGYFDGAKVCNGVILDRNKRFLGVKILGEKAADDEMVPSYNCQLLFEPEWRSQYRGIPRVGKSCMDWFDAEDIDVFLKRGVKLDASIPITHFTETGEAPTASDIIGNRQDNPPATAVAQDVKIERRYGGEILYMKANVGEKVETIKSERPHPNTEAFIARIERRGLLAVGWFYELLDPSKVGGASVRMIQDEARHQVRTRQSTGRKRALRAVTYAVAKAMQLGFISKNEDGDDWAKWGFNMPPVLTVDQGYDEDADRENLKIGTTTLDAISQKKSVWWKENRSQRKKENINLIDCAAELVEYAKSRGVTLEFNAALDLMQQQSPTGRPEAAKPESQNA